MIGGQDKNFMTAEPQGLDDVFAMGTEGSRVVRREQIGQCQYPHASVGLDNTDPVKELKKESAMVFP
jgi:hypothetical protein